MGNVRHEPSSTYEGLEAPGGEAVSTQHKAEAGSPSDIDLPGQ